ncbi:hypothetical protein QN360_01065 [Glaciimonas sp. CA11.2]|uniref:hypothetical protein n=1 Tax=Glaciimonas sp. CA11.2 TaxID=3048601 RepID=UPI002AB45A04|nr:hypothetical protein [Glaciimonas sp. CA11.2]MDY7549177.1 hypothetical protein [Glaciimonas sp. CA11.2]MEB0161497.1 hypothetical protein [Glaciimonas sp. CA11.2]
MAQAITVCFFDFASWNSINNPSLHEETGVSVKANVPAVKANFSADYVGDNLFPITCRSFAIMEAPPFLALTLILIGPASWMGLHPSAANDAKGIASNAKIINDFMKFSFG